MATLRLYAVKGLTVDGGVANIHGLKGDWANGGGAPVIHKLVLDKTDQVLAGAAAQFQFPGGDPGDKTFQFRFAYPITIDTRLESTFDLGFFSVAGFGAPLTTASVDMHWVVHAYVTEGATGNVRGVLLDTYAEGTGVNNLPVSLTGAGGADSSLPATQLNAPVAFTGLDTFAGDYLVVELGFVMQSGAADSSNVFWYGCRDSSGAVTPDIVAGDARSTMHASWIEINGDDLTPPPEEEGSCSGGVVPQLDDPEDTLTFTGLGPHYDRVFVEIDLDDGMVSFALHDPMNDSPDLARHPGRKDGRILSIDSIVRRTTGKIGEWQASSGRFTLDDHDRYIRGLIDAQQWYNRECRIYVAKRDDVANARCLLRGIIRAFPPQAGLTVDVEVVDIIGTTFSPFSLDKDILAGAVYDTERVPEAPRELLDQDPKKPIPVYGGIWSDEASDADPPVLTGNPAIGSQIVGGLWIMGYGNMPSGPGTPSNLTAVVASGGSINAADLPYGVLYAQVWGIDGSGAAGDPFPFLPAGLPITITGTGQKVTLTVTAGFTPTAWRFALATKYYGARWAQILEVPGGTTSVVFDVHPVFPNAGPITAGATPPTLSRRWYRVVAIVDGARTGPSAECGAAENTPYYRPIHVTNIPVTDADSYEVYGIQAPFQPFTSYNRRWDVPVQLDGDGFQYFEDFFDDSGVTFVAGINAPVGVLPVDDTGDEVISGVTYGRLVASRWAMREILGVYAGGVRFADDHPDLLHPDHPDWPFADRTRLLGDVECTVIYAKGTILTNHRSGKAKVQFNACTLEDRGDGRGDGITQSARLVQQVIAELVFNDHKVGLWEGVPLFPDGTPMLRTSSYEAEEARQIARVGGTGYPGRIALLKPTTLREFIAKIKQSLLIDHGINNQGQVLCGEWDDPIATTPARYTDTREVVGNIGAEPRTEEIEVQIPYQSGYRPLTDDFETPDGLLPSKADAPTDPAVIDNRGEIKLGPMRSMAYVADNTARDDVLARMLLLGQYVRHWVEVPVPIIALATDLFDHISLTDEEGIGAEGYVDTIVKVLEHEVVPPDPSQDRPLTVILRGLNVTPILEEAT